MGAFAEALCTPDVLTAVQIAASGAALGLTAPGSIVRPALLPLGVAIVSCIAAQRTGGAGRSLGLLLQFVEIGLVRGWSYVPGAGVTRPLRGAESGTERTREVNGHAKANGHAKQANGHTGSGKQKKPEQASTLYRAWCGVCAMFSFRRVGTPDEVKGVPQQPARSRLEFFLRGAVTLVLTGFGLEAVEYMRVLGRTNGDFSGRQIFLFRSILDAGGVDPKQLFIRCAATLTWWVGVCCLLSHFFTLTALVAVAVGASEPGAWRPLFGSITKASTLRGLWGDFWHQLLRGPFSGVTELIAHDVLRLPRRSGNMATRYLKVLVTFSVSGVYHVIEEVGNGHVPLAESGAMRFFVMQAVGIIVEDWVRRRTQGMALRGTWMSRGLGYAWVAAWLVWTTPSRMFPNIRHQDTPVVEVNLVSAWLRMLS